MKTLRIILPPLLVILALCAGGWLLVRDLTIDVLEPSGVVAAQQKELLMITVFLSSLVVVPVFTLLVVFSLKYRASNTHSDYRPEWSENKNLERLWWGIPIFIIGILGFITYQTSHSLDPYRAITAQKPVKVEVVAMRWKWLFLYPEYGVATLNYAPLPLDQPVEFNVTANAPMSALWIPALGSQIYAMEGMKSKLNLLPTKVGTYTGYTTNINGEGYSDMTFATEVMQPKGFKDWIKKAALSKAAMNMDVYKGLMTPKSITEQRTYQLANSNLMTEIIQSERMDTQVQKSTEHDNE